MDVFTTRAEFLDVNCYAVRADGESDCILIDAGFDAGPGLAEIIAAEGLRPRAVILTHGHPDHILGLPSLLSRWDVPVHLGAGDGYRLEDPGSTLGPQFVQMIAPLLTGWSAPAEVVPLEDGTVISAGGLSLTAIAAPGHTEGSMLLRAAADGEEVVFTGDVVFAGAIGRIDLPGGDGAAMAATLRAFAELPDLPLYPGHGPGTRVGHELATNPFL